MKSIGFFSCVLLCSAVMLAWPARSRAEGAGEPAVRRIVLHPAAAPRPALKFSFVVPFEDRRPGNAAVVYNRIFADYTALLSTPNLGDKLLAWSEAPLVDLNKEASKAELSPSSFDFVARELSAAARLESCDWQYPVRDQKPTWGILLPDLSQDRQYARMLAPYVRWQIAQGRYEEAVASLRSGYYLARNVGKGPFLVNSMVGVSIAKTVSQQAETFIQQPDAPNLYWAYATMPKPLVDFRPALECEMSLVYLSYPELCVLDKKQYTPQRWREILNEFEDKWFESLPYLVSNGMGDLRSFADVHRLTIAGQALLKYPRAKRLLVERGRTAAEVDAMPPAQVILLYTTAYYDEIRDDLFKWSYIPYPAARKAMAEVDRRLRAAAKEEIIPLASTLLPSVGNARHGEIRSQRDLAALQLLEALRLYAASHDGSLPDSLADVTEVPVPPDPFSGQAFVYRREGNVAYVDSFTGISSTDLRYRIEMKGKGAAP